MAQIAIVLLLAVVVVAGLALIAWVRPGTGRPRPRLCRLRPRYRLRSLLLVTVAICLTLAVTRQAFAWGLEVGLACTVILLAIGGALAAAIRFFATEIWDYSLAGRRSSLSKQLRERAPIEFPSAAASNSDEPSGEDDENSHGSRRPDGTPWWARPGFNRYRSYGKGYELPSEFRQK